MIDQKRKEWLRGAYMDRIREYAMTVAKGRSEFSEPEVAHELRDEYDYLHELSSHDHAYLREETVREVAKIIRENRESFLSERYRREMALAAAICKLNSADCAYHFVDSVFDAAFEGMMSKIGDVSIEDRELLRDIFGLTVWKKLREARGELRTNIYKAVVDLNPGTITPQAAFAMDIGWRNLLQHAADRIETHPSSWRCRVSGGKEKFGYMQLSIRCDYRARGCRAEVDRMLEEVRLASLATCEVCGNQGRLRLSSVAKTVCDKHSAMLGRIRDDDGVHADPLKWHNEDEYPAASAFMLRGMDPVRPRPSFHVIDEDSFGGFIARQIEVDLETRSGREHELLFEFCGALEHAAYGSVVKTEYLDHYVAEEVGSWVSVQPLSDDDKTFLCGYLRSLIDAEYERVKNKQTNG